MWEMNCNLINGSLNEITNKQQHCSSHPTNSSYIDPFFGKSKNIDLNSEDWVNEKRWESGKLDKLGTIQWIFYSIGGAWNLAHNEKSTFSNAKN